VDSLSSYFTIEYTVYSGAGELAQGEQGAQDTGETSPVLEIREAPAPPQSPEGEEVAAPPPSSPTEIHFTTPPPVISPHVNSGYGSEPLRFRAIDDFVDDASPPWQMAHVLDDLELHLGTAEEPPSFAVA
jgi:hypothetical protein